MNNMLNDKRKIKLIYWEPDGMLIVGSQGITEITSYGEYGQMAEVPWFKVWKEDFLWQRINGATIAGIQYEE